ncbi:MAG TPA: DUF835 domain-containing protein [Thermoplasmata archaeon]|nr:DUF835 domain-containing protein [Thermoplasmata archaeon]
MNERLPRTCPLCDFQSPDSSAKCTFCGNEFGGEGPVAGPASPREDMFAIIGDIEKEVGGGSDVTGTEDLLESAKESVRAPKTVVPRPARPPGSGEFRQEIDDLLKELETDAGTDDATRLDDLLDETAGSEDDAKSIDDILGDLDGGSATASATVKPAAVKAETAKPAVKQQVIAPPATGAHASSVEASRLSFSVSAPAADSQQAVPEPRPSRQESDPARTIPDSLRAEVAKMRDMGRMAVALLRQLGLDTGAIQSAQERAERISTAGDFEGARNQYKEVRSQAVRLVRAEITKVYRELASWNETVRDQTLGQFLDRVKQVYEEGRYAEAITFLNKAHERIARARPSDMDATLVALGQFISRLPAEMEYVKQSREGLVDARAAASAGDPKAFERAIRRGRDAAVTALYVLLSTEIQKAKELGESARVRRIDVSGPFGLLKRTSMSYKARKYTEAAAMLERYRVVVARYHEMVAPVKKGPKTATVRIKATAEDGEDWQWDEQSAPTQQVRAGPGVSQQATRPFPAQGQSARTPPTQAPPAPAVPVPKAVEVPVLEEGVGYLIKERKAVAVYHLFAKQLAEGRQGMCICTSFPDRLKDRFNVHNAKFLWLTMIRESGQGYDPERLDFEVTQEVYEFITSMKGYVIVFDALDLLISEQGAEKTVEFIRYLSDHAAMDRGTLLVAASGTIDEGVMGNLERFLEECPVPEDAAALKKALGL